MGVFLTMVQATESMDLSLGMCPRGCTESAQEPILKCRATAALSWVVS